jgi:hypothetical protein
MDTYARISMQTTNLKRRPHKDKIRGESLSGKELGLLGGEEVQSSVKFVKLPSPHPQPLSQWERVAEGRVRGPWPIEPHSSAV